MVLILSIHNDFSTNQVIDWLHFLGKDFFRINYPSDMINVVYQDLNNTIIKVNDQILDFSKITSFWYRKGDLDLFVEMDELDSKNEGGLFSVLLKKHLVKEKTVLEDFMHYFFSKTPHITSKSTVDVNKLEVLSLANRIGLNVPRTAIVTSKKDLTSFMSINHDMVITKPISIPLSFRLNGKAYMTFTESISRDALENIPNFFFPSLVQQMVGKKIEIRSFYLDNIFYSMAIFSQQSKQTTIDFRKYNYEYPNRVVPFQLPEKIENQLVQLMDELGLKTGSIDLIYSPDQEFYFLEVNPVGQFGMVSYPCNYYLEEKIAKVL